jgi:SOS-response transcriptional repressor LexA
VTIPTPKPLTEIQARALGFIRARIERGETPTADKLREDMGYRSRSTAAALFQVLKRKGHIQRKRYGRKVRLPKIQEAQA